jgi:hypothetical protein
MEGTFRQNCVPRCRLEMVALPIAIKFVRMTQAINFSEPDVRYKQTLPARRRTFAGRQVPMEVDTSKQPSGLQMSDFIRLIRLDEVREARQIRSRLAALHEMECHLVRTSEAVQRLASSPDCATKPDLKRE